MEDLRRRSLSNTGRSEHHGVDVCLLDPGCRNVELKFKSIMSPTSISEHILVTFADPMRLDTAVKRLGMNISGSTANAVALD